jgi:hypothetical protein
MKMLPSRDDEFPVPPSLTATRFGVAPATTAEEVDYQPRECSCEPRLTGSGGDFGFDDGMRSLRRD